MSKDEPIVFLIDLDGTIQGNVHPQIVEYELIRKFNSMTKSKVKYNLKNLHMDISRGLIRPHFKNALLNIKKKHDNVEFFVYTASSDTWANFLLPNIIRVVFNKRNPINKPFLTRSHCVLDGKMKSIDKVKPIVANALKAKYPNGTFKHIYLIDNNIVLQGKEISRLIYCPSYDYRVINCPLRNFNDQTLERYHKVLSKELFHQGVNTSHKFELMKIYYDHAFKDYVRTEKHNEKYANDKYWKQFEETLIRSRLDTDRDVMVMAHKLRHLYFPKSFSSLIQQIITSI